MLESFTRFSTRACFERPAEFKRRQIKNAEKFMLCFDAKTLSVYAIEHAEHGYRLSFINDRLTVEVRYRSPSMGGMRRFFQFSESCEAGLVGRTRSCV